MTTDLTLLPRVAHRGREVTAPRLRGLLALLAGDVRSGCSTERLVAGLWPDEQPEHPGKALQVLVSRARAQLGADVIASTPTGYRLTLTEDRIDSSALLLHATTSAGAVVYFLMVLPMSKYLARQEARRKAREDTHEIIEVTELEVLKDIRDALVAQRGSGHDRD
ncbi:hypothetical protein [Streptomyces sp. NPDC005568]|uniref:hypothetical protein n=1 Tax=Streptomyces sp. NPDC005568 TaxID=3156887 RepID=UPI0033A810DC